MAYPAKKIESKLESQTKPPELAALRERTLGLNWSPEPVEEDDNSFMVRCAQVELIDDSPRITCRCSLAEIERCVLRMMIKQMKWQS